MTRKAAPSNRLYTRTTVPLKGTVRTTQASLDFASDLALQYAQAIQQRTLGQHVPSSGIVRRALAVYVDHLQASADLRQEARQVTRCCSARNPDDADQAAALKRLAEAPTGQPLAPFLDILRDPAERAQEARRMAALDDQVEALVESVQKVWRCRRPRLPACASPVSPVVASATPPAPPSSTSTSDPTP